MFRNQVLLIIGNFSKFKFKKRPNVLSPSLEKTPDRCICRKIHAIDFFQNNGFLKEFSFRPVWAKIKRNASVSSDFVGGKCWKCKKALELKDFACSFCGALQNPEPKTNFFKLLGVSQAYNIDVEDLTQKFRKMQMIFHPDKFLNKSKEELEISEEYSRLLNKAYTTLKDPVARGFYLLESQNISKEPDYPMEQHFLMKIMELNEELENAQSVNSVKKLLETNSDDIEKEISAVKDAFGSQKLEEAKQCLMKLNYYVNLNQKLKEKLTELKLHKT